MIDPSFKMHSPLKLKQYTPDIKSPKLKSVGRLPLQELGSPNIANPQKRHASPATPLQTQKYGRKRSYDPLAKVVQKEVDHQKTQAMHNEMADLQAAVKFADLERRFELGL